MDTQEVGQGQEDIGNRSAIEDAINSLGGDDGGEPGTRNDGNAPQTPQAPGGRVAEGSEAAPAAAAPKSYLSGAAAAAQQQKPQASLTDTPARPAAPSRAPQSWRPEVREEFNKMPPAAQAEVLRREREVQGALQESASARQFVDKMVTVMAPYQQMIAMEGDVVKVFGDYLKTSATLRMGTPVEKANAIAQAVRTFGVDIAALDSALTAIMQGQPMPQAPFQQPGHQQRPQEQQQFQDPRVDQILEALQAREYESQQRTEVELDTEIATFASKPENEFFEVLRDDISHLLGSAAQMGKLMSLEQAYKYACTLHPEISKIVQQREAASRQRQLRPQIQARQNAASSLRSSAPAQTGGGGNGVMSVRESIEAAIDGAGV